MPCLLVQWERVKKVGMAPGPRSSFAMMTHKNRALLFGGVSDNETKVGCRGEGREGDEGVSAVTRTGPCMLL